MFTKSSTLSKKIKIKETIINQVKNTIYKIGKGNFNSGIKKETAMEYLGLITKTLEDFEHSIGSGEEDFSVSAKKIEEHLNRLVESSKGNLEGRLYDDSMLVVTDLKELIDLENGVISKVVTEDSNNSRSQDLLYKKIKEIAEYGKEFIVHKNRVEDEIVRIERDKKELDEKLIKEKNKRIQNQLFNQINANMSNIKVLQYKSDEYTSCYQLLESIIVFSKELVAMSAFSKNEKQKANIIMNVDKLRLVLDDPKKLQPILKSIERSLAEVQEKNQVRNIGIGSGMNDQNETSSEMEAYIAQLKSSQDEESLESVKSEVEQLDEVIEALKKNRNL